MLKRRYRSASRIDSVVDVEKLKSGPRSCLERDPAQFFNLTYLTEDLQMMLRSLSRRFSPEANDDVSPGLILAEGIKGQGQVTRLAPHLSSFRKRRTCIPVDGGPRIFLEASDDSVVLIEKFTDQYLPFDSLWSYVGRRLVRRGPRYMPVAYRVSLCTR